MKLFGHLKVTVCNCNTSSLRYLCGDFVCHHLQVKLTLEINLVWCSQNQIVCVKMETVEDGSRR